MKTNADALVLGGGLHGLSAALQLARRGVSVILLEKHRIGRHSSGASAAGVRTRGRAREELPLSLVAMEMWHNMEELVGDDCGFHSHGQMLIAETEAELRELQQHVDDLVRDGFTNEEIIHANELRDLVPALAPHCVGASFARYDGAADPHRTLAAFRKASIAAGATIVEGAGVSGIERKDGVWRVQCGDSRFEAPMLVNAAGAWGGQISAMAGDDIVMGYKCSMMIVTERIAPLVEPTIASARRGLSFKQSNQGTLLIGGGHQGRPDFANERADIDARSLAKAAAAAVALFPSIPQLRIVRSWAGLEAKSRDDLAVIGLSPTTPGLMHLFGFSGHGFQLVPATGIAAADLLLEGSTRFDLTGLEPERLMKPNGATHSEQSSDHELSE